MSTSSHFPPPPHPSDFYDERGHDQNVLLQPQDAGYTHTSPMVSVLTRTVAIIKTQALEQRLEIEPRILEANFEIVKERQMEFDTETEPETFYELFGDDARFLGDGPVWVYVLERRRAVPVLLSLLPSLNNAVIGAKSEAQAEMLIQALFASSPPFQATDLPPVGLDHDFDRGSIRSVNSAVLEALQLGLETPLASSHTLSPSPGFLDARSPAFAKLARTVTPGSISSNGKAQFRARALPKTHVSPDITPRLTKAALLRQGLSADGSPRAEVKTRMALASTGRIPPPRKDKENEVAAKEREKERAKKTFAGVPGHKRTESIVVASTAPPTIAPRLTKAAALRLGLEQPTLPPGRRASVCGPPPKASGATNGGIRATGPVTPQKGSTTSANEADGEETEKEEADKKKKNTFEGVPGHKRRESFSVASTKPPTIVPRMNRSAALKKEGGPPPSSFMFRTPTVPKTPGSGSYSRSSSAMSAYQDSDASQNWSRPRSTVPSRAASRNSHTGAAILSKSTSSYSSHTSSSGTGTGPLSTTSATSNESEDASNGVASPTRMVARPTSLGAPTIVPRPNKSAMLRLQKQAAEAAKPKSLYANASRR